MTLSLDLSGKRYVGLFGQCSIGSSVIKNVTTTGFVNGNSYVGGIVGYGAKNIINCHNKATVTGSDGYVGGISGGASKYIINCSNRGDVTGINYVGGVLGSMSKTEIINCLNQGSVTGGQRTGGIAGNAWSDSITNCVNNGKVNQADGSDCAVGGIAGAKSTKNPTYLTMKNCYYNATLNSGLYDVGHSAEDVSTPFTDKNCAVSQGELVSEDVLDVLNMYVRSNATVNGTSLLYWKAVENDLSFTSEKPNLPYAITNKSDILTVASEAKPGTSVEITVGEIPSYVKSVKIIVNGSILKANGEGKYVFTMPEQNVTVDAQMELNLTKLEDGRYAISTAEELAIFAKAVNSGIFREEKAALTADIKASTEDGFEPIGTKSNPYGGSFYGDGHTLTLDITEGTPYNETTATGLFGVTNNANVYDLILKGSVDGGTDTNSYTGALIGATDSKNTYVYNVYSEATVSGCGYVGGIVGRGDVFAGLIIVVNNGKVVQKDSSDDKKAVGAILGMGGTGDQNLYFNSEKNSGMFDRGYDFNLNKVEQNSDACVPITEEEFFTDNMMDRLNTSVYSNQNNGMKLKFWDISPDEKTVKFATDCPAPLYDISPGNFISSQCIDAPGNSRAGKTITVKLASDIDLGEGIKGILGIRVTNAKGDVIEIQETDDNTYKFTMPEEEVYIWVLCEYDIETDDDGVYCIENEEDLITFAQIVEGGQPEANAKVMAESMSIEKISESVSESDGLIGQNTAYKGTFDGNNAPIVWYDALFGKTDGAVIKNMNISTAVQNGSAGLVVSAKDTRIDHCDVRIEVYSPALGGIVYSADGCKITNCSVTAGGFVQAFGGIAFMPSDTVIANCVLNECVLTAYMYGGIAYATAGNTKIYNCVNQDTFTAGAQVVYFAGAIVGLRQTPDLILENNFFYASNNCMDVVGDIVNGNLVPASAMMDKNSAVSDEDVQALYIPLKLNEYVEKNPDLMAGTTLSKWGNSSDAETGSNAACFADAKHPEICPITQSDIMVDVLVNGSVVYGAGEGAEVTLRDVPSSAKVTVTDKNGNKVEITGQEDTYQFTMPAGAVTVSVVMNSGIKETTEIDGKTYVVVKTAEDFIKAVTSIAQGNNALNVKIAEDITLTSDILQSYPVYSEETSDYNAIFDGAGHTVTFDGLATSMLPSIGEKGMIKDLTIAGSNSGTAGIAVVALVNKGTIMNCINKVNISGELAAGFVSTNRGTICNCINKGDMYGSNLSVAIAGINQGTVSFVANEGTLGDASVGKGLIANGNEVKNSLDLSAEADKSVWAVNAAKFNGALEKEKADSSLYDNCREWSVIETDTSAELVFADEENAAYYMCTTPDGDQAYQVGDTVEVTVDSLSIEEGMKIESVTAHAQYTDETFDVTPVDGKENTFSFIMPGKTCKVEVKQVVEGLIKDEDGYFLVGSLEDLKKVKKNIEYGDNDSDVKLTADIASYDGTPIGGNDGYNGTFDGNGHSITLNMQDNSGDYQYFGLFGTLNSSAVVKNLTIKGSIHAYDSEYVGAVAGKNCGTVTDCVNNADIIGVDENNNYGYAGGIVGLTEGSKNSPAKLSNCVNNGDITGYDAGGIVSSAFENSAVSNCRNNGTVTATCDDVGGIAAEGYNTEIINCVNTGNLSGEYAGGVVSNCWGNVQVSNCANTGNVYGLCYSGGIVGYGCEAMSIKNCFNSGNVTGDDVYAIAYYDSYGGSDGKILNSFYLQTEDINAGLTSSNMIDEGTDDSEAVTAETVASGYVAYQLRSGQAEDETVVWGQTLSGDNADAYPILGGKAVYRNETYKGCEGNPGAPIYSYSNKQEEKVYIPHDYVISEDASYHECSICHETEQHTKDEGTRVEPTCEGKGSFTYTCTKCGKVMEVKELDPKGHTWDAGIVTKEATETEEGEKTYTCTVCGKTKTEAIPKKEAEPTPSATPTPTATASPTPSASATPAPSASATPAPTASATPAPSASATPAPTATATPAPTASAIPAPTASVTPVPAASATPEPSASTAPAPIKNEEVVRDDKGIAKYEVADVQKKEVKYKAPANKKAKTVTIPSTVKINGVTYKVTGIANSAFKGNKTVKKVTVGKNIKSISKNAFKGCKKLKTITIKSTKLTSKTVAKNAFQGLTKATTIKVPKKKLKAYKKLFKSKGLSSKVKVKGY